jgi:microcompartment protein CcmL/EutN
VYLTIPAEKKGKGKILVSVNGAVHEIDAVTNGNTLASGEIIRVINIVDDNLLLVEKL